MDNLVSIIIPVFNRFEYADRAILSVLNQTYTNWELFVIDDCSNQKYELPKDCENIEQKIELLHNEQNSGPGLSRQRGLNLSTGKFVCFLDSDDYWLPDFLQISLNRHAAELALCATYCQSIMTDGQLRRRNRTEDAVDDLFFGVVSGFRPWATCALMWKKKYLASWTSLRTNQDALFELETSLSNPEVAFIPSAHCVVDKETGANAIDLVSIERANTNRHIVLLKAHNLIDKYTGQRRNEIKKALWKSLYLYTKKMWRHKNYYFFMKGITLCLYRIHWRKS
jgi:glycosyltransferase involved in cell wall biosynthesis